MLSIYLELAKARLVALVLVTTGVGYALAAERGPDIARLLWALLGTALTAGGANAFNQWIEVHRDARMGRTCRRPLPTRRIAPGHAFGWAMGVITAGTAVLASRVNLLTAALGLAAALVYVLLYTPLKPRSSLCTLVGAVCGAIPPMMGWTAATGRLDYGAWLLGAILFIWQIPHFLSMGWMYRDEYAAGGFRILPVIDPSGRSTCQLILLYSLALLPLGMAAAATGLVGPVCAVGSLVLGAGLLACGARLHRDRTATSARRLFLATIVYLPLLMGLMVADRGRPANGLLAADAAHELQAPAPRG